MWAVLEPEDVWFFRDGKPFNAGENFNATGDFPPTPSTVSGALRTYLMEHAFRRFSNKSFKDYFNGDPALSSLRDQWGDEDNLGELRIAGPIVCTYGKDSKQVQPIFPLPADVIGKNVLRPMNNGVQIGNCKEIAYGGLSQNFPFSKFTDINEPDPNGDGEFSDYISEDAIIKYLCGASKLTRDYPKDLRLTAEETRVGIAISGDSNTTRHGMFYTVTLHRPVRTESYVTGLLIHLETPLNQPVPAGYLSLGGECRSAYLNTLGEYAPSINSEKTRSEIVDAIKSDEGRFRLYLATPGIFGLGIVPRLLKDNIFDGLEFEFLSASCSKPIHISGWDMRNRTPRPTRRAVPPGAVYLCRLKEPSAENICKLMDTFHLKATLQQSEDTTLANYWQQGYGLTLVGAWAS